eukprot:Colp12_sorted_trinity150504_noHs@2266
MFRVNSEASASDVEPRFSELYPNIDQETTHLPTTWNQKDKNQFLDLTHNSLRVHYKGQGKDDTQAAAVRANHPIPSACGVYYYEVRVIDKGRDGYIGIGVCAPSCPLSQLPGWGKNSYGYHGDDGSAFSSSGHGNPFGPTYSSGDIVGCGVNFLDQTIFYTKNGNWIGVCFKDVKQPTLYPTVGLRTPGEILHTNFGQAQRAFWALGVTSRNSHCKGAPG